MIHKVVILDCNSFIKNIEQKIPIVKRGLVNYTDGKAIDPFTKRKVDYSGQNERINNYILKYLNIY